MTNIEKQKRFGLRVVKYSPYELVIITLLLCLGKPFVFFNMVQIICPAIIGALASILLIKGYKTGKGIYAAIYGGLIGLTVGIILLQVDFTGLRSLHVLAHLVYFSFCIFFGTCLIFTLLRKSLMIKSGLRFQPCWWGLIVLAGLIVSLSTVLGFVGRFAWFFDLFSHFRMQYFISLSLVAFIFLLGRKFRLAIVFTGFALLNATVIVPLYFPKRSPLNPSDSICRAMLINVNTGNRNFGSVTRAIKEYDPDFVVLEEVDFRWIEALSPVRTTYPFTAMDPRPDNFGIALFSKMPLKNSRIVYIGRAQVPSIIAEIDLGNSTFTIVATHTLPPRGIRSSYLRDEHLAALPPYLKSASSPVLLLGDLNVTPWSYHFRRLINNTGLLDSSEGRGVQPTWPTHRPLFLIPIDHCLHSPEICIVDKQIGPKVGSDHYPVIVDFTLPHFPVTRQPD